MAPSSNTLTETVTEAVHTLTLRPSSNGSTTQNGDTNSNGAGAKPVPVAAPAKEQPAKAGERLRLRWYHETAVEGQAYPYERFLPTFDGHLKLPPLEPFTHVDPGLAALQDPEPRLFLQGANVDVEDITPDFGTEVSGVQIDQLDTRGRQQLALYVAQRGVVVSWQSYEVVIAILNCNKLEPKISAILNNCPNAFHSTNRYFEIKHS